MKRTCAHLHFTFRRHVVTTPDNFNNFLILGIVFAVHGLHFVPRWRDTVPSVVRGELVHHEHQFGCESGRL